MIRSIRGKSLVMGAAELVVVGLVAAETLGGGIVALQERAGAAPHPLRPPVSLGGNVVGNISGSKRRRNLLEKCDPQYQQWNEEAKKKERAVELEEQAEVFAKVIKDQFGQTMSALSPSLITPPPFAPSSPSGVANLPLVVDETRGQNDLLEAPQLRWIEAELLHKVSSGRNGVSKEEFVETLGEHFGDRRFVAALGEFMTRCGGGAVTPRAKEARSGMVFDIARRQWGVGSSSDSVRSAWSWYVDSSCFSWDYILGIRA